MESPAFKVPRMPREYYRRQAARGRTLAQNATTIAIREHVAEVALQYERLAEGVEAGYRFSRAGDAAFRPTAELPVPLKPARRVLKD